VITAVTSLYGDLHVPYMGALLESLHRCNVERVVLITDDSVPPEALAPFTSYANVETLDATGAWGVVPSSYHTPRDQRVSRKLMFWWEAHRALTYGDCVVYLDADTLVLPYIKLNPFVPLFLHNPNFDLGVTTRLGRWPVNSGVVFARWSPRIEQFMETWLRFDLTLLSGTLSQAAIDLHGSADQASLVGALGMYRHGHEGLMIEEFDCEQWNCQTCPAKLDDVAVAHLKGCLPYLTGERRFGEADERDETACAPLFARWQDHYQAFLARKDRA